MKHLYKLAEIYNKLAQDLTVETTIPQVNAAIVNHAIKIERQSQILSQKIQEGIDAGITRPEARAAADGLNNTAIKYRQNMQELSAVETLEDFQTLTDNNTMDELEGQHQQMIRFYEDLTRYVGEEYEPMVEIEESLSVLFYQFHDQL